ATRLSCLVCRLSKMTTSYRESRVFGSNKAIKRS
ncbi:FHIPEP family protein, partial [Vibrio parahaemolyticus V-223/04]